MVGGVSIPACSSGPEPGGRVPREHAEEQPWRAGGAVEEGARSQQAKGKEYWDLAIFCRVCLFCCLQRNSSS